RLPRRQRASRRSHVQRRRVPGDARPLRPAEGLDQGADRRLLQEGDRHRQDPRHGPQPVNQAEKARAFKALHERQQLFVIPNPWDGGSAKILASQGFEALTTTSAGLAFVLGKPDGGVTREQSLWNAKLVVDSVDLPVAADLENGFGHRPEDAAETIRQAAAIGLVGGSIEESAGDPAKPTYDFNLAVERVAGAAEAARKLPFPFMFVARAENFLHGRPDLDDTIKRLQAFEKAGADVLFPPGMPNIDAIRTVIQSVGKPVNI